MTNKLKYALVAVSLALAISACSDQQAQQEEHVQTATLDQPGFEDKPVTSSQAESEALTLAGHLASGDLEGTEAADALEDLDRLVNDNIVKFPEDIRPVLTEDIQSARSALEAGDMDGLKEAAIRIQRALSGSAPASAAK